MIGDIYYTLWDLDEHLDGAPYVISICSNQDKGVGAGDKNKRLDNMSNSDICHQEAF